MRRQMAAARAITFTSVVKDSITTSPLYLTAFSDHLFKEKRALWADEAFLDKPCTPKALLEAVALLMYGVLDPGSRPPAEQP